MIREALSAHSSVYDSVLAVVEGLTDEQIKHGAGLRVPSISFHLWHLARWTDHDAEVLAGTAQIWLAQGLRDEWGLSESLGEADAGTELEDNAFEMLELPDREKLLAYAQPAFSRLSAALAQGADSGSDISEAVMVSLTHGGRHLGMIEALRGMLGLDGSATR